MFVCGNAPAGGTGGGDDPRSRPRPAGGAFERRFARLESEDLNQVIRRENFKIHDMMARILASLEQGRASHLPGDLVEARRTRLERIVLFLGLLELVQLGNVTAQGRPDGGPEILIRRRHDRPAEAPGLRWTAMSEEHNEQFTGPRGGRKGSPGPKKGLDILACPEAMLLVSPEPLAIREIQAALEGTGREEIEAGLEAPGQGADGAGQGLRLEAVAGGYRLATQPASRLNSRPPSASATASAGSPAVLDVLAIVVVQRTAAPDWSMLSSRKQAQAVVVVERHLFCLSLHLHENCFLWTHRGSFGLGRESSPTGSRGAES
ncbi:MAG: SMC-Scp complex subunit ScpB [Acidobacteriota bacterium]|nr:SMC-Scp complex subunit ScpB [Acidobacteriota bacterium]